MHVWESKHVYKDTRMRIDAYLDDEPQGAIKNRVNEQMNMYIYLYACQGTE